MQAIIEEKNRTFDIQKEKLAKAFTAVKNAVELCENLNCRQEFIKVLKNDADLSEDFGKSFCLIRVFYGLDEEQKACYEVIKEFLK